MSFTDLLKSPIVIAGLVGTLAIGGGTVIYVVQQGSGTTPASISSTPSGEVFPQKFVATYDYRFEGKNRTSRFQCDLTVDGECSPQGAFIKIKLHKLDLSRVSVEWNSPFSSFHPKKSGLSWQDMSDGIYLDKEGIPPFVKFEPIVKE